MIYDPTKKFPSFPHIDMFYNLGLNLCDISESDDKKKKNVVKKFYDSVRNVLLLGFMVAYD